MGSLAEFVREPIEAGGHLLVHCLQLHEGEGSLEAILLLSRETCETERNCPKAHIRYKRGARVHCSMSSLRIGPVKRKHLLLDSLWVREYSPG